MVQFSGGLCVEHTSETYGSLCVGSTFRSALNNIEIEIISQSQTVGSKREQSIPLRNYVYSNSMILCLHFLNYYEEDNLYIPKS